MRVLSYQQSYLRLSGLLSFHWLRHLLSRLKFHVVVSLTCHTREAAANRNGEGEGVGEGSFLILETVPRLNLVKLLST